MADWYSFGELRGLADENHIILADNASKQLYYDILLICGIIDAEKPPPKPYGILGWEIPHEPAEWVNELTGTDWDPRFNPILTKSDTWVHHLEDIGLKVINEALDILTKHGFNIYPKALPLHDHNIDHEFESLVAMCEETGHGFPAMVGWEEHMRFLYINRRGRQINFYDPWKVGVNRTKFFANIKRAIENFGYEVNFIKRLPDQSEEESCVIDSLARVLLMSDKGEKSVHWPWTNDTFDYALVSARIIHIAAKRFSM